MITNEATAPTKETTKPMEILWLIADKILGNCLHHTLTYRAQNTHKWKQRQDAGIDETGVSQTYLYLFVTAQS